MEVNHSTSTHTQHVDNMTHSETRTSNIRTEIFPVSSASYKSVEAAAWPTETLSMRLVESLFTEIPKDQLTYK